MLTKIKSLCAKHKRVLIYGVFGVLTTLVNLASYIFFTRVIGTEENLANIISWIIAVSFAFITNKIYVFESKTRERKIVAKEAISFFGFRIATGVIEIGFFALLVTALGMNDVIVKTLLMIAIIILNYIFSKIFVFAKKSKSKPKDYPAINKR